MYAVPRSEDSTFIAVFDPQSREKKLQYNKLDNRVSIILPVNNTVSETPPPPRLIITMSQLTASFIAFCALGFYTAFDEFINVQDQIAQGLTTSVHVV